MSGDEIYMILNWVESEQTITQKTCSVKRILPHVNVRNKQETCITETPNQCTKGRGEYILYI